MDGTGSVYSLAGGPKFGVHFTIVRLHEDPTEKGKAAVSPQDVEALGRLLLDFLNWKPSTPHEPTALSRYLAPLTRFLRAEVEAALGTAGSAVELLANEWRQFFFPEASDSQFADAYAQTVAYSMLLARLSGATKLDTIDPQRRSTRTTDFSPGP